MIIVYYSKPETQNTLHMLKKLEMDIPYVSIYDYDKESKYILVTPTYGQGNVPDEVEKFLADNHANMLAVISGGNRNWGMRYARSGDLISKKYNVPLLVKFELRGKKYEIPKIKKAIGEFYELY